MKKRTLTKILTLLLTLCILSVSVMPIFASNNIANTIITSGQTYMLKNKATGKYLTLPGYIEYIENQKNNIYQYNTNNNDQYSRAVRVTYNTSTGKHTLVPLLYEYLSGGYVSCETIGNVVVSNNIFEWAITYVSGNAYKILDSNGKALTSVGTNEGSVDTTGISQWGNIIVSDYTGSNYQLWEFEAVTVNPHIFKSTSVTKKNIGMNAEWLFKLSDSEMANNSVSVTNYNVSGNTSAVEVRQYGKYVIVKTKYDGNEDRTNDYAIITITVKIGENITERTVIAQNTGMRGAGACITLPFEATPQLRTLVLDGTSKEYMMTFKSNLGNVNIVSWQLFGDTQWIEFSSYNGKELVGSNFAVIRVNDSGFAVIRATSNTGDIYDFVIETQVMNSEGTYKISKYVKTPQESNEAFELQRFRYYLFKTTEIDNITSEFEFIDNTFSETGELLVTTNEFAVVKFDDSPDGLLYAQKNNGGSFIIQINPANGAIIIIPGIMGSQIFADEDILIPSGETLLIFDEGTRLWDPSKTGIEVLNSNDKVLALKMNSYGSSVNLTRVNAPTINEYNKTENDFQYGAQDMYRDIYNQMYEMYFEYGYDIVFYEYDWRYDPYDTAMDLNSFINEQGYNDIVFVAHSMGGLVSAYYISSSYANMEKINSNISIGTPYLGSAHLLDAYISGKAVEVSGAWLVGFYNAVKEVIYNFPSIYSLIPFEQHWQPYLEYKNSYNQQISCLTYLDTIEALSNYMPNWNDNLCEEALSNRFKLFNEDGSYITENVLSYYIVGTNINTTNSLNFEVDDELDVEYFSNYFTKKTTIYGDGTVTLQSSTVGGTLDNNRIFYKTNSDGFDSSHVGMITGKVDSTTIDLIDCLIDNTYLEIILSDYGVYQEEQ